MLNTIFKEIKHFSQGMTKDQLILDHELQIYLTLKQQTINNNSDHPLTYYLINNDLSAGVLYYLTSQVPRCR